MAVGHNALGLAGNAERALMALALKYELTTGVRVKWRRDQNAIYDMVAEAIKSDSIALVDKAVELLEALPKEIRRQFVIRGIEPLSRKPKKVQKYRGVAIESTGPIDEPATVKTGAKTNTRVWRGAVGEKG